MVTNPNSNLTWGCGRACQKIWDNGRNSSAFPPIFYITSNKTSHGRVSFIFFATYSISYYETQDPLKSMVTLHNITVKLDLYQFLNPFQSEKQFIIPEEQLKLAYTPAKVKAELDQAQLQLVAKLSSKHKFELS